MTPVDDSQLPRLAIFYDEASAPVFELVAAARDLCRILWLVGWSRHQPGRRMLSRFGEVMDFDGKSSTEIVDQVVASAPDGVIVFSDSPLLLAAEAACRLGLAFHSPTTARLLVDKLAQRQALREAGLPVPVFEPVGPSTPDVQVPFPAVLKPRSGEGSRDVFLVETFDELSAALSRCSPKQEFMLEELLLDRSAPGSPSADIVSVESIVDGADIQHVMVTGRLPFAPPFRETGSFLPSNLTSSDWDAVTALAGEAAKALAITTGVLHTEIKLTPQGPRLIEVNGRLGGEITSLLSRAGGPSLTHWAMKLALGLDIGRFPHISTSRVAFFRLIVAPVSATKISSIDGVAELSDLAGINSVEMRLQPGDNVDAQMGFMGYVLKLDGVVDSHAQLFSLMDTIESTLTLKWDFAS